MISPECSVISPALSTSAAATVRADDRASSFAAILGFGNPMRMHKVLFDTGSDFSWIHCDMGQMNFGDRYAPYDSNSSQLATCGSSTCYEAGGFCTNDAHSYCSFSVRYMDSSNTVLTDTLTITPRVSIRNFIFGCTSTEPQGYFGDADGLIGLGRGAASLPQQISLTLQNGFSYCIPSAHKKNTGFLTFGRMDEPSNKITFTKMLRHRTHTSWYFVELTDIYVGEESIPMPNRQYTFVDSGTTLTYIPPVVHANLTRIFRREFQEYLISDNAVRFGGCFNFTDAPDNIYIPQVTFSFNDGATLNLGDDGTFYKPAVGKRIACLAFQSQEGVSMIGKIAHQSMEVIYDTRNEKLGFGEKGGC